MKSLSCALALAVLSTSAVFGEEEGPNLLKNEDFAVWTDEKPANWAVVPGQFIRQVTDAQANGATTALRVEITKDGGENLGEIRQKLPAISGARYRFEGMMQSTKPGLCVFMIKLRTGSTETQRLVPKEKSGPQWTQATLEFEAGDASEIHVLCRYKQTGEFVGGSGEFTKLKLVRLD